MKRLPLPPDTRLDWRNPSMPVIRDYRFGSGERKTLIDPDYERRYREMLVNTTTHVEWYNDPTYKSKKDKP